MVVTKSRKPQLQKSLGISEMNSDGSLMHHLLLLGQWTLMSSAFSSYLLVHELSSHHRGGDDDVLKLLVVLGHAFVQLINDGWILVFLFHDASHRKNPTILHC